MKDCRNEYTLYLIQQKYNIIVVPYLSVTTSYVVTT